MRLREIASGIVVSVDGARGAEMVGPHWELADKPAPPDHNESEPVKRTPRKSRS